VEKSYRGERLLRSRDDRPRSHCASQQDGEIAAIQLCEMHPMPLVWACAHKPIKLEMERQPL
jgi:hypothetical protein